MFLKRDYLVLCDGLESLLLFLLHTSCVTISDSRTPAPAQARKASKVKMKYFNNEVSKAIDIWYIEYSNIIESYASIL